MWPVPSSLALSTTRMESGVRVWCSSADRQSRSISLRSCVTTTAQTLSAPPPSGPASAGSRIPLSIPTLVRVAGPEGGPAAGQGHGGELGAPAQEAPEARALL